jgi:aryl-alcohol dehydrogenase-like predicted oxidoreductase
MPYRSLGSTGVIVSALGLGGYHLGLVKEAGEAVRIVHRAIDAGVTFFDCAWGYHQGESERRLGQALRGHREKAFVMTKLDGQTKAAAAEQLDESLARLNVDHIDLLQIHEVIRAEDPSHVFAEGGAIETYVAARAAGKIRFIGFTGHKDPAIHLAMLDEAAKHGFTFDAVQMPLNVLDHHFKSFEGAVLPRLKAAHIGVLGMKPLASGKALKSGVVTAQECLRYALSVGSDVTITGCESMGVLEQALAVALSFEPMSPEARAALVLKTIGPARDGAFEEFKTKQVHDSTVKHPEWLGLRA